MKLNICRDCGAGVPDGARGCPNCARNLDAERMLARYFRLALLPALILAACLLFFYLHS